LEGNLYYEIDPTCHYSCYRFRALLASGIWAQTFNVDSVHSSVEFKVRHMGISNIKGSFTDFSGSFAVAGTPARLTALKGTVGIDSIDTHNENRDKHLRTADFFVMDKHPKMTFEMAEFIPAEKGSDGVARGKLTLLGVTKEVDFAISFGGIGENRHQQKICGFSATTVIKRSDYGMKFKKYLKTGEMLVGDAVHITLEIEGAVPKKEE